MTVVLSEKGWVRAAKGGDIDASSLSYREGDDLKSVTLDYRGGHRYPRLERIEGKPDRLTSIFSARK